MYDIDVLVKSFETVPTVCHGLPHWHNFTFGVHKFTRRAAVRETSSLRPLLGGDSENLDLLLALAKYGLPAKHIIFWSESEQCNRIPVNRPEPMEAEPVPPAISWAKNFKFEPRNCGSFQLNNESWGPGFVGSAYEPEQILVPKEEQTSYDKYYDEDGIWNQRNILKQYTIRTLEEVNKCQLGSTCIRYPARYFDPSDICPEWRSVCGGNPPPSLPLQWRNCKPPSGYRFIGVPNATNAHGERWIIAKIGSRICRSADLSEAAAVLEEEERVDRNRLALRDGDTGEEILPDILPLGRTCATTQIVEDVNAGVAPECELDPGKEWLPVARQVMDEGVAEDNHQGPPLARDQGPRNQLHETPKSLKVIANWMVTRRLPGGRRIITPETFEEVCKRSDLTRKQVEVNRPSGARDYGYQYSKEYNQVYVGAWSLEFRDNIRQVPLHRSQLNQRPWPARLGPLRMPLAIAVRHAAWGKFFQRLPGAPTYPSGWSLPWFYNDWPSIKAQPHSSPSLQLVEASDRHTSRPRHAAPSPISSTSP